jgi:hypothetical protein
MLNAGRGSPCAALPRVFCGKKLGRLATLAEGRIFDRMSKSPRVRVIFKLKRVAEGDWQIEAHCPGAEIRYVTGFKSKAEVDDWLQGTLRIDWLRSQGYAK